ncbi:hypothetical protein [Pseudomonas sp. KNUC1026]|uniref:hypothetical protein n=1 Tax=Pseudomonas sp. KNUC1026 TaxID=2893890 RepID=UPI001F2D00EB|nr:hypothetical protein [Pseudomonas sp. KNUC1026]UFH49291.1 hypothetical protein LN139_20870 [Pseudomonas sp. KNUC1026]
MGIVANTTAQDVAKRIADYSDSKAQEATDASTRAAWEEGGAARVALHAAAGALQGLAGGSVQSGAIGAGLSAALMPGIEDMLGKSGLAKDELNRKAISTLVAASLGAASATDTAGRATAGQAAATVEAFNRQLHEKEKKLIAEEADRLAELTKTELALNSLTWKDLLLIVSSATVDEKESQKLSDLIAAQRDKGSNSYQVFLNVLATAYNSVQRMADTKTAVTWADGSPIVADGEPVYAFQASKAQYKDALLFNTLARDVTFDLDGALPGQDPVPETWKAQFGDATAAKKFFEIAYGSTNPSHLSEMYEDLALAAIGGGRPFTADIEIILALAGPGGAGSVIKAFLRNSAEKAAVEVAGKELAKSEIPNFILVGSAEKLGSAEIQKDTTVLLTNDVLLKNGISCTQGQFGCSGW